MDPTKTFAFGPALYYYNEARKWFTILNTLTTPVLFIINAPFGRFTPKNQSSIFLVDGRKSWIVMELVSPLMFLYTFITSPLTVKAPPLPSLTEPHAILALCYLVHYANRAILSPLRTPSRSKTHIIVPLWGIFFNTINGSLMGSYLSSPYGRKYTAETPRTTFYIGLTLWALGLIGNIYHDEVLLNIRRKANNKGKGKADNKSKGEHYAIPQGGLYSLISYPNYFCEWIEWLGFALAASPLPFNPSEFTLSSLTSSLLDPQTAHVRTTPLTAMGLPLSEVVLMLPRAYKGHKWYHEKFGDSYPKQRKVAVPFLL
ncbi:3-oxo-5-alpha-steroid 4-dehydrogenase-domain-containing protein [Gymnopilus junonius]|uniref:3-oxo-5-alpha-steroid 4-dehydrogenase-domain-containing protein n=1 Tax=Gymnopilus junonius TaxID=109634 RepID=A0A9P5NCW5_GYMJU|nr:3-oxo-5-alpha-steroid 4-dehydrogenase-domain-containing protein [Gymnopilus junonius]